MSEPRRLFRPEIPWSAIAEIVLPAVRHRRDEARAWTCGRDAVADGCTLALLWRELRAERADGLHIIATDMGLESASPSFSEDEAKLVPGELRERWMHLDGGRYALEPSAVGLLSLAPLDVAHEPWPRQLDLIVADRSVFDRPAVRPDDRAVQPAASLARALHSHAWLVAADDDERVVSMLTRHFEPAAGGDGIFRARD